MSKRTTLLARRCIALVILTLTASVAHAQTVLPEWASRRSRNWSGQPQLSTRTRRFVDAPAPSGRIDDAMLLCRVHVRGRWDVFADPDLRVRARLGRRSVDWWGSENSRTEVFSVPRVSLRRGDRLTFRIVDRDVTFDDTIGTVQGRYRGGPVSLRAGQAEIECRQLPDDEVQAERRDGLQRAAMEITRLETTPPDLMMDDLGRPSVSTQPLIDAATWAGWSDADVAEARRRHLRAEAQFDRALARAVREAHRAAPEPGASLEVDGGTVRVVSLECGRRAQARMLPRDRETNRCAVVLAVSGDARLGQTDILTPAGVTARPTVRYLDGEEAGRVVLALPARPPVQALLRFGAERRLLRLR